MTNIRLSKKEVNTMLLELMEKVVSIGIPIPEEKVIKDVKINNRKRAYGLCRKKATGDYRIELSKYHLSADVEEIKNTILHEILHTAPNCMNHGEKWKSYAEKIRVAYGYDIQRTSSKGLDLPEDTFKYIIKCKKCKVNFRRMRNTKFVRNYSYYKCGCGGELERIK